MVSRHPEVIDLLDNDSPPRTARAGAKGLIGSRTKISTTTPELKGHGHLGPSVRRSATALGTTTLEKVQTSSPGQASKDSKLRSGVKGLTSLPERTPHTILKKSDANGRTVMKSSTKPGTMSKDDEQPSRKVFRTLDRSDQQRGFPSQSNKLDALQQLLKPVVKRAREEDKDSNPSLSKRRKQDLRNGDSRSSSPSSFSGPRQRASSPPRSQPGEIDLTGDSPRRNAVFGAVIDLTAEDDAAIGKHGGVSKVLAKSKGQEMIEEVRKSLEKSSNAAARDTASASPRTRDATRSPFALTQRTKSLKSAHVSVNSPKESLDETLFAGQKDERPKELSQKAANQTAAAEGGQTRKSDKPDVPAPQKRSDSAATARANSPGTNKKNTQHSQLMQERVDSAHSDGEDSSHLTRHEIPDKAKDVAEQTRPKTSIQIALGTGSGIIANASRKIAKAAEAQVENEMERAATATIPLPMASLGLSKQVEVVLGRYLEESRGDNEYSNRAQLRRARMSLQSPDRRSIPDTQASAQHNAPYSFAKMQPMKLAIMDKENSKNGSGFGRFLVERTTTGPAKAQKVSMTCPTTTFTFPADMPGYSHFVPIKENFLAPNVTTIQSWPYFGDDFDFTKAGWLGEQYSLDIKDRELKLRRLLQAQQLDEYAENALQDLSITWADVLRFLLEVKPSIGNDEDAKKALARREEFCKEEFSRKGERTAMVLSLLPPSTTDQLAKAATLCENFRRMTKFDLWHVARRHMFDTKPEDEILGPADRLDELTCRICLRLECPHHGEIVEQEDNDCEDPDEGADHAIKTDIIHPLKVNYRTRIAFPVAPKADSDEQNVSMVAGKRSLQYWRSETFIHNIHERGPFYGCDHPGSSCSDVRCSCFELNLPCEKICTCSATECSRKFQGCICKYRHKKKGQHIVCFEDDRCICFNLGRECDPDLCGECGVDEVLDPLNRHDNDMCRGKCQNASIQRGVPKHTLIGESGIHGLGLYAGEHIKAHDFVGEYKGEIITKEEAERRGAVYEHQKLSYLFVLNATQEIDSTYFGNDIRFINHASNYSMNLYPRIFLVNAVHRIALFAEKDIPAGRELLFDYGPKFPEAQLGGKAKARNTKEKYYEPVNVKDKQGNVRARKVIPVKATKRKKSGAEVSGSPSGHSKKGIARPKANAQPLRKSVSNADLPTPTNGHASPSPQPDDHRRPPEDRLAIYYMAENEPEKGMDSNTAMTDGIQDDGEDEDVSEFEDGDEEDEPSSPNSGSVASSPGERRAGTRIRGRRRDGSEHGVGRRHALRP